MKVLIAMIAVTSAVGLLAHRKYALMLVLTFLGLMLGGYVVFTQTSLSEPWKYGAVGTVALVGGAILFGLAFLANIERNKDEAFLNDEKIRVRKAEEEEVRKTKEFENHLKIKGEAEDVLNEKRKEWNDGQLAHQECILMKKDVFTVRIRKGGTKFYLELLENQTVLYKEKL